jgi:hypothetical protein
VELRTTSRSMPISSRDPAFALRVICNTSAGKFLCWQQDVSPMWRHPFNSASGQPHADVDSSKEKLYRQHWGCSMLTSWEGRVLSGLPLGGILMLGGVLLTESVYGVYATRKFNKYVPDAVTDCSVSAR